MTSAVKTPDQALTVALVTDGVDDLLSRCGALFQRDEAATPFASPQWTRPWVSHWQDIGEPWVLVVQEHERTVGLAAFVLRRRGPIRFLQGLGTVVGNYWDVIAAPEERDAVARSVAAELRRRSAEWDALILDRLPDASVLESAARAAGLRLDQAEPTPCPGMALPNSYEDYLSGFSSSGRQRFRRRARPIDDGTLTIRSVTSPTELSAAVEHWSEMRARWWQERGLEMNPEHSSERFLRFTREAISAMVPAGLAVVWEVLSSDEVIGVSINFVDDRTFYYWLSGFDPRAERLRPGHAVIAHSIRWSIESGRTYYDFMIGGEPYKYEYGADQRTLPWLIVGNDRLRSRAGVRLGILAHRLRVRSRDGD